MSHPYPSVLRLAALLLALRTVGLSAQQSAAAPGMPPPLRLQGVDKRAARLLTGYPTIEGGVLYGMNAKKVTIYWRRDFSSHLPDPLSLSEDGGFVSIQEEPTGFWPTEVCAFGVDRICVAGKTTQGMTRIQLWTLDSSALLEEPTVDGAGMKRYPEAFLPVLSKIDLYHESDPEKQLVRTLFRNHGRPTQLFVQFDGVRDIWTLDTATNSWTRVLTSTAQPHLVTETTDRWSAHHSTGYFYAFSTKAGTLLLFDHDFDGAFDPSNTLYLTGNQWYSGTPDFSDASGYIEHF